MSVNSKEIDSSGSTWSASGLFTQSGNESSNANASYVVSGVTYSTGVSDSGSDTTSGSFTETIAATETTTATQAGTFSASLYQAGVYNHGSFALTSVVYNDSSTSSSTTQTTDTFTASETTSATDTTSTGHSGSPGPMNTQSATSTIVYTSQGTITGGDTLVDSSIATQSLYEAGTYSNESYSLSSYALLQQASETVTRTSVNSASATESGSTGGSEGITDGTIYSGSGTFTETLTSNATMQQTNTVSWSLSEQGTFANGSLALSSFVFSEQQTSSDSMSQSGAWTETFSGTNQGQGYSGTDVGSFASSNFASSSATLLEQGSFINGSFSLSCFSFSAAGTYSFSDSESDSSSWTGNYHGSEINSSSASGSGNWSLLMLGSYSNGQWNLSTDLLQGSSSSNYNNSASSQEYLKSGTPGGAADDVSADDVSPSLGCGSSNITTSYTRSGSGSGTESLYQAGQVTGGTYSNSSYSESRSVSDTIDTSSTAPSYNANDSWVQGTSATLTGSGSSGTLSATASGTYDWNNSTPSGSTDSGNGSNNTPVLSSGTLPQGVVAPSPDGTSVPQAGAEQSGGGAPVSGWADLSLVASAGAWMWAQAQYGSQASDSGVYSSWVKAPPGSASAAGAPGGNGASKIVTVDNGFGAIVYPGERTSHPSAIKAGGSSTESHTQGHAAAESQTYQHSSSGSVAATPSRPMATSVPLSPAPPPDEAEGPPDASEESFEYSSDVNDYVYLALDDILSDGEIHSPEDLLNEVAKALGVDPQYVAFYVWSYLEAFSAKGISEDDIADFAGQCMKDFPAYFGGTVGEGGQKAADTIKDMLVHTVDYYLSALPGPELLLFQAFGKAGGFKLAKKGGKWLIQKVLRKGGVEVLETLGEAEAKALYAEFKGQRKLGLNEFNGNWKLGLPPGPQRNAIIKQIADLKSAFLNNSTKRGKIVWKTGEAPVDAAGKRIFGKYNSIDNTIELYKDADLSTLAHELLHYDQAVKGNRLGKPLITNPSQRQIIERDIEWKLGQMGFVPKVHQP